MPTQLIAGDNQNEASFAGGNDGALEVRIGPAGSKATGLSVSSVGDVAALGKLTQKGGAPVPRMLLMPAKATTSGTFIDFSPSDGTGIPSWAKKITIMVNGVSTNSISFPQFQFGTLSGIETTGYDAGSTSLSSTTMGTTSATSGFILYANIGTNSHSGSLVFTNMGGNVWVASGSVKTSATLTTTLCGGKTLAGVLDRVRLTTVNGTDVFDAGSISILVEGYE